MGVPFSHTLQKNRTVPFSTLFYKSGFIKLISGFTIEIQVSIKQENPISIIDKIIFWCLYFSYRKLIYINIK